MKPMLLAMFLSAATAAVAQDAKADLFKDVQYGNRIEVMLVSEFGVTGQLTPYIIPLDNGQEQVIELIKAPIVLLDLSLEYPELGGSRDPVSGKFLPNVMGIEKKQIKGVRVMKNLSPEEVVARQKAREDAYLRTQAEDMLRREEQRRQDEEAAKAREAAAKKRMLEEAKTREGLLKQQAERMAKGRELHDKFPPDKGWGPEKLKEIQQKASVLRQQPTPEEREFVDNIETWLWYKSELEKEQGEKKGTGEKTEQPK